jgi:tetratricopeptide (TPR) repeat protein
MKTVISFILCFIVNHTIAQELQVIQQRAIEYFNNREYKEALFYLQKLENSELDTGFFVPHTMGVSYVNLRQINKAGPYLLKALNIAEKTTGKFSPEYILTASRLCFFYEQRGEYGMALSLMQSLATINETMFGHYSRENLMMLSQIANTNSILGEYKKGDSLFSFVLNNWERKCQKSDEVYFLVYSQWASSFADRHEFSKAKDLYKLQLATLQQTSNDTTEKYADIFESLAVLSSRESEFWQSEKYYQSAIEVAQKLHVDSTSNYSNLIFWISGGANRSWKINYCREKCATIIKPTEATIKMIIIPTIY